MKRRDWLLAAAGSALLPGTATAALQPRDLSKRHDFALRLNPRDKGRPVNRLVLGQNVQWTDGGDGMLDRMGQQRQIMVDKLAALRPTTMRFPGGAQSDSYRWQHAMGAMIERKSNLHFHAKRMQPSIMGTQEFLELCELVGAQPFITVNTVTGSAQEAADWLKQTNRTGLTSRSTGKRLPRVPYWEIGNEPYLKEGDESQRLKPVDYVKRANEFIRALRAVDPSIQIGVPLRTAKIGGLQATPYPDFAHDVLTGVKERFDFISNHNAYMPYLFDGVPDDTTLFWGVMGAASTVNQNLDETAALSRSLRAGWNPIQAITEYNALFTLGKGDSDGLITSPLGAMYVADLVRTMVERDDLLLCQYWSLSSNWKFGAIAEAGYERPGYVVLKLLEEVVRGNRQQVQLACGTFDAPRVGAAAPANGIPLITSLVTRDGDTVRMLLINKDIDRPATGSISFADLRPKSAQVVHVTSDRMLNTEDRRDAVRLERRELAAGDDASTLPIVLPPASVSVATFRI